MKIFSFFIFSLFLFYFLPASGQEINSTAKNIDTTSLLYAFKKGKTEGHFRLYYMSTNNSEQLTDYYALAFGGGLRYQTRSFKGFQFGIGGFFIWNLASSDLTKPDPETNIMNRYEIGQFDIEDPANKNNMQRLEDFYIRYNFKHSWIRFGKQGIKTPFVNPQDGRMRPTGEQGFWAEFNEIKKTKIEAAWLLQISPRGTMKWYRGASSIGIYSSGLNIDGTKSNYKNNLNSKGTAIVGINHELTKNIKLQLWDNWGENIFNTFLFQGDASFPIDKDRFITSGLQYINQQAVNDGGNTDASKTYFDPTQKANIYGASAGYVIKNSAFRFNYTRITKHGRFLFPREWGREPLYTFLPRERNEGLGDVHAFSINLLQNFFKKRVSTEFGAGYYHVPDVKDYRLNKYGLPSYYQFNFNVKYSFNGFMKGMHAELLYCYKKGNGNTYNDLKYVVNKVDMGQLNIILNYIF